LLHTVEKACSRCALLQYVFRLFTVTGKQCRKSIWVRCAFFLVEEVLNNANTMSFYDCVGLFMDNMYGEIVRPQECIGGATCTARKGLVSDLMCTTTFDGTRFECLMNVFFSRITFHC
jgi:hypothetical protein